MTEPLICNLLIGLFDSEQSTFAKELQKKIHNGIIITDDRNKASQLDEFNPQIIEEITDALANGKPVIVNATNSVRAWRMTLINGIALKMQKLNLPAIYWRGWQLIKPSRKSKQRKLKGDSSSSSVIERYQESLHQFPPHKSEGFIELWDVEITDTSTLQAHQYKISNSRYKKEKNIEEILEKHDFSKKENYNRRAAQWHQYSKLLNFERLMHLFSTIVRYPGLGELHQTEPELLKQILKVKKLPPFATPSEEIAAVIEREYAPLYADLKAIERDLIWLQENGLLGSTDVDAELKIALVDKEQLSKDDKLYSHRFSSLDAFTRLIKTIRLINYYPFLNFDGKTGKLEKLEVAQGFKETVRLTKIGAAIIDNKISLPNVNERPEAHRKRVESVFKEDLKQLSPYRILHDPFGTIPYSTTFSTSWAMKYGYFIGTGIFSISELNELYNLVRSQSDKDYFNAPLVQNLERKFAERMKQSKLWQGEAPYPVKIIGSKSLVDYEENAVNLKKFEDFERAIKHRKLIKMQMKQQDWGKSQSNKEEKAYTIVVYPLQVVFHRLAWYLGYQIAHDDKNKRGSRGLFCFARIDRLTIIATLGSQTLKQQQSALKKLARLYQGSAGIYLGWSVGQQKMYLDKDKSKQKQAEVTVTILATRKSFNFLKETSMRFPEGKMRMSKPDNFEGGYTNQNVYCYERLADAHFPHVYRLNITLPKWSLGDIELEKWLVSWGGEIIVTAPKKLANIIHQKGQKIQQIYSNISLIVSDKQLDKMACNKATKIIKEEQHLSGYILLQSKQEGEHQLTTQASSGNRRTLSLSSESAMEENIEQAVSFVIKQYSKYKQRNYTSILICCPHDKKLANKLAAEIYAALTQKEKFAKVKILLHSDLEMT